MFHVSHARVVRVAATPAGRLNVSLQMPDGTVANGTAFPRFTGDLREGDCVVVNTTAGDLDLGTSAGHLVLGRADALPPAVEGPGHLMKWRYTPWQRAFLHAEEDGGVAHEALRTRRSLAGRPVVALGLHSELEPVVLGVRARRPAARVVYVHTDGAALPVALSDTIARLKADGSLAAVVATGQAQGGDADTIAVPTALLTAAEAFRADVVVAGMGPGIVGSGTRLGHTATEQAWLALATVGLGGRPLMVARLGGGDRRARHQGISHHTLAVLEDLTPLPVMLPWPAWQPPQRTRLPAVPPADVLARAEARWNASAASRRHLRVLVNVAPHWRRAVSQAEHWSSMGRRLAADPLAFSSPFSAGLLAAALTS